MKRLLVTDKSSEPFEMVTQDASIPSLRQMERKLIMTTLDQTNGNRTHAAKLLGISLRTLRNKLREYRMEEASTR